VSYDGLSKIRLVKQFFRTVSLKHGYQSTYNIGSYRSNSTYAEDHFNAGSEGFALIKDINDNYTPQYDIQSVTISEQFSPLISADMTMKNSLNLKIEFKRSRNLTLNIANAQVTEVKTQEYIIGTGYRFKSVTFKTKTKEFKSDLNVRLDFSIRDNLTIIRKVIEDAYQVTAGQNIFTLKLNADYNLSKSFNVRFFFDWIKNAPRVSNRFKTSNINFGLSVRFSLS
jgi:cell surface protein SprA